jgi:hypothetical protein
LAAFRETVVSQVARTKISAAILASFSPVPKSRFPETETAFAETGSTEGLLSSKAQDFSLALSRQIEQAGEARASAEDRPVWNRLSGRCVAQATALHARRGGQHFLYRFIFLNQNGWP